MELTPCLGRAGHLGGVWNKGGAGHDGDQTALLTLLSTELIIQRFLMTRTAGRGQNSQQPSFHLSCFTVCSNFVLIVKSPSQTDRSWNGR